MKKLILIFLILADISFSQFYVAAANAGSANGSSWANAKSFASMEGGWDELDPGTTVYIDGGSDSVTYTINAYGFNGYLCNPQGTAAQPIIVTKGVDAGHNGKVKIVKSTSTSGIIGFNPSGSTYTTFKDLEFAGGLTDVGQTYLVFFYESGTNVITFEDCTFMMNYSEGVGTNGSTETSDSVKFLNCDFLNLYDTETNSAMDMFWLGGANHTNWHIVGCRLINYNPKTGATEASAHRDLMQCEAGWGRNGTFKIYNNLFDDRSEGAAGATIESEHLEGDWQIYNNIFKSNSEGTNSTGFFSLLSLTAQGSATTSLKVYNNVFISASSNNEVRAPSMYGWDNIEFKNNIIYKASGGFWNGWHLTVNGGTWDFDYNLYSATNTSGIFQYGEGGTNRSWAQWTALGQDAHSTYNTNEPTFVDETDLEIDGYALEVGSDGIDDGTTIIIVTEDIIGVSRPQGSAYDIGAFEYSSSPPAPTTITKPRRIIIQ